MTTLDKQALEKAIETAERTGWFAHEADIEAVIRSYLAALPEARRWVAFYPAGRDVGDMNNAYFYTSKEDFHRNVRASEEPGWLTTIEIREVRQP